MKHLIIVLIFILFFAFVINGTIQPANAWTQKYICTGRTGTHAGYGRPSKDGEYSAYWQKKAAAGEFIIFQYKPGGKEYWFYSFMCRKL